MKLNPKTIQLILAYADAGFSSRRIAGIVGVSKSTVNNYIAAAALNKQFQHYLTEGNAGSKPKKQGPRILVWDCETAPALSYTFGRWKQNIGQDNIVTEGGWIICASYKWLGEDETHLIYNPSDILEGTDQYVVRRLWSLYEQADAVVAHNALGFDHKVLQGRCLVNGINALPNVKVLDTLQMAKKHFRLPSNKLDSIAELLGIGRKQSTGGIRLWIDTMSGCTDQLENMLQYCKQDTALLEEVYLRLRTFGTASNFNAANYYDDEHERCNICGSTELEATGRSVFTDVSKFQEIRCKNCGGIHRKRQALNSKEKRKSLLATTKI